MEAISHGLESPERRRCLRFLSSLGLGALASSSGLMTISEALAQQPALEDKLIFMFTGGLNQKITEEYLFPPFQQKTGIKTLTFIGGTVTQNVAKIRAQAASPVSDVIYTSGAGAFQARSEDVLGPIDPLLIPNLAKIGPLPAGQEMLVPFSVTNACLIYNTKVFAEKGFAPPTTWEDLWDTKYKGHVGSFSVSSGIGVSLILAAAKLAGKEGNLDAGFKKLATLRPNIYDFFTSGGAYDTAFTQGDVWIGINSTTRALQMRNEGWPVASVIPKEGAIQTPGYLSIVKNAPHPKAAHTWIDFMLGVEAQSLIMQHLGLSPVNPDVPISAEDRQFHPTKENMVVPDWGTIGVQMRDITARWNREVER